MMILIFMKMILILLLMSEFWLGVIILKNDPDIIIHVKLLAWHNKFEKCKVLKKR